MAREQEGESVGLRMLGMSIVLAGAAALFFFKFLATAGGGSNQTLKVLF